jgi:lipopolysaccharide biosynthesis regulator YciM
MTAAMTLALVGLLALVIGVLLGRYYVPDNRQLARTAKRSDAYARAINHVLDGQPDAAVELLKRIVDEDTDDLEPYFALGALFRARGEWERAIRVHQAISLREPKNKQVRRRAAFALGQDFLRAGMPRRATRALEECVALDGKHQAALAELAVLYEEQGRYRDAAETLARLSKLGEEPATPREHHLLVAAAQHAMRGPSADLDEARRLLRDARRISERSVHALVARAELAAAHGDAEAASAHLAEAMELAPELAAFLLPGLIEAQRQLARDAAGRGGGWFGRGRASERPSEDDADADNARAAGRAAAILADTMARIGRADEPFLGLALAELRSHYDPEAALADYRALAERFPDLLPAQVAAARLALASGDDDAIRAALARLTAASGVLGWAMDGAWRCSRCGHRQDLFFWRCRSCRAWGSVRLELGRDALVPPPAPPWEEPVPLRGGVHTALAGAAGPRASFPSSTGQAAPMVEASSGSSRAASLWSRVGAWFGGLGQPSGQISGQPPGQPGRAGTAGAPLATDLPVTPVAAGMPPAPVVSLAAAPAPATALSPDTPPAPAPGTDPDRIPS